jgi:hypothetical protein
VDNYYATLEGSDYLADLFVGRMSVVTEFEAQTVVAKILGYERDPYDDGSDWFRKASLMAGDLYDYIEYYRPPKIAAYDMMIASDYLEVDTFFVYETPPWPTSQEVLDAIEEGRAYLNFRANSGGDLVQPFDGVQPHFTRNGYKLPVFVAITCCLGSFIMDDYWTDERWLRVGTPEEPQGAVGFFSTSTCVIGGQDTHTPRRNAIDEGIFKGIFEDSLHTFGASTMRGRLYVIEQYPNPESLAQYTYEGHNILGDPELNLWTATPVPLDVEHLASIYTGQSTFDVTVSVGRTPVEGALVCVMMDTLIYDWGYTDASGEAQFDINPGQTGTLEVTVTHMNAVPYEGSVIVAPDDAPHILYLHHSIVDSLGGNANGLAELGEQIEIPVWVMNYGGAASSGAVGRMRISEEEVSVLDSMVFFDIVPAGDSAVTDTGFLLEIGENLANGQPIDVDLTVFETTRDTWTSSFSFEISAPEVIGDSMVVNDFDGNENGFLDPGERSGLLAYGRNIGATPAESLSLLIRSRNEYVEMEDSTAFFGDIYPDSAVWNEMDSITLVVSDSAPEGEIAEFDLIIATSGLYSDSGTLQLVIGGRQFLVLDLDLDRESGPVIEQSLYEAGYRGQYSPQTGYFRSRLDAFESVFICLGNPLSPIQANDYEAFRAYMSSGGNVYMEGPSAWVWYPFPPDTLYQMFGAEWGAGYGTFNPYMAAGVPGGLTHGMTFDYNSDESVHGGALSLEPGAQFFMRGVTSWGPFYSAVAYDNGTYKSIGNSMEIGRYIDGNPPSTKIALMDTIMGYFGIVEADVHEEEMDRSATFTLFAPRPNPTRGGVTLTFALPERGPVNLRVYDAAGRLVRTLVQGEMDAGEHVAQWSGTDDRGHRVAAGIYFTRLSTRNRGTVRKLVMLR